MSGWASIPRRRRPTARARRLRAGRRRRAGPALLQALGAGRAQRQLPAGAAMAAARNAAAGGRDDPPPSKQLARLVASYGLIRQAQGRRLDAVHWLNRAIEAAQRADRAGGAGACVLRPRLGVGRAGAGRRGRPLAAALELYDELGQARAAGHDLQQPRHVRVAGRPLGRGGRAVRQGPPAAHPDRRRGRRRHRHAQHRRGAERPGPTGRGAAAVRGVAARVAGGRVRHRRRLSRPAASGASPAAAASSTRAAELYVAAREQFRAMVSESELVDTDARIAEALVFQARSRRRSS